MLPIGGGAGFGFVPIGGGFAASELPGLDDVGVWSAEESCVAADAVRFQGAADPLEGAIPGKTATGLAEGFAVTALAAGAAGTIEGGRLFAAGGGGGGGGGGGA